MPEIPLIVLFGPSLSSYLIGAGRRFHSHNMPQSLLDKLSSGDLPIRRVLWASIDKTGRYWCAENFASGSIHFDLPSGSELYQHILKSGAQYVSWPDYDEHTSKGENGVNEGDPWYLVNHKNQGHWNASLPSFYISTISVLRNNIPEFDAGLKYVIFGKGGTHIYQFESGFLASLEGEHNKEDHPLNQALRQFDPDMNSDIPKGLWMIDKGSTLSLYDHRYFFIRFINTQTKLPEYRFCLPPEMEAKLRELLQTAGGPQEQEALAAEEQDIINQVNARLSFQVSANNMLNSTMNHAGLSFANAALPSGLRWELQDQNGMRRY